MSDLYNKTVASSGDYSSQKALKTSRSSSVSSTDTFGIIYTPTSTPPHSPPPSTGFVVTRSLQDQRVIIPSLPVTTVASFYDSKPNVSHLDHNGVPTAPRLKPDFNSSLNFVEKTRHRFHETPEVYNQFLDILRIFQRDGTPIREVCNQVSTLFNSSPDLIAEFKLFLPDPVAESHASTETSNTRLQDEEDVNYESVDANDTLPMNFNNAVDYINQVKNTFGSNTEVYIQFLQSLRDYQRDLKTPEEVYDQVTSLFEKHPNLIDGFRQFLPSAVNHAKIETKNSLTDTTISDCGVCPEYQEIACTPRDKSTDLSSSYKIDSNSKFHNSKSQVIHDHPIQKISLAMENRNSKIPENPNPTRLFLGNPLITNHPRKLLTLRHPSGVCNKDDSTSKSKVDRDELLRISNSLKSEGKPLRLNDLSHYLKECEESVCKDSSSSDGSASGPNFPACMHEFPDKVRCMVPGCQKIFIAKRFLEKHMQNKHQTLIEFTPHESTIMRSAAESTYNCQTDQNLLPMQEVDTASDHNCELMQLHAEVKRELKDVRNRSEICLGFRTLAEALEERLSVCCGCPMSTYGIWKTEVRTWVFNHFRYRIDELKKARILPFQPSSNSSPSLSPSTSPTRKEYISGLKSIADDAIRFSMVYPEQSGYFEIAKLVTSEIDDATSSSEHDCKKIGFQKFYQNELSNQKAATSAFRHTGALDAIYPGPIVQVFEKRWKFCPTDKYRPLPEDYQLHQNLDARANLAIEIKEVMVHNQIPGLDQLLSDVQNWDIPHLLTMAKGKNTASPLPTWRACLSDIKDRHEESSDTPIDRDIAFRLLPDFRYAEVKDKIADLSVLLQKAKTLAEQSSTRINANEIFCNLNKDIESIVQPKDEALELIQLGLSFKDLKDTLDHLESQISNAAKNPNKTVQRRMKSLQLKRASLSRESFRRHSQRIEEYSKTARANQDEVNSSLPVAERILNNVQFTLPLSGASDASCLPSTSATILGLIELPIKNEQQTLAATDAAIGFQLHQNERSELESKIQELEDELLDERWNSEARSKEFQKEASELNEEISVLNHEIAHLMEERSSVKQQIIKLDEDLSNFLSKGQC